MRRSSATVRVGSRRGGGTRPSSPQTYPGTYSGYGATRADSVGEPVAQYAYSSAQQQKAFNAKQQVSLPKEQPSNE